MDSVFTIYVISVVDLGGHSIDNFVHPHQSKYTPPNFFQQMKIGFEASFLDKIFAPFY